MAQAARFADLGRERRAGAGAGAAERTTKLALRCGGMRGLCCSKARSSRAWALYCVRMKTRGQCGVPRSAESGAPWKRAARSAADQWCAVACRSSISNFSIAFCTHAEVSSVLCGRRSAGSGCLMAHLTMRAVEVRCRGAVTGVAPHFDGDERLGGVAEAKQVRRHGAVLVCLPRPVASGTIRRRAGCVQDNALAACRNRCGRKDRVMLHDACALPGDASICDQLSPALHSPSGGLPLATSSTRWRAGRRMHRGGSESNQECLATIQSLPHSIGRSPRQPCDLRCACNHLALEITGGPLPPQWSAAF